ncbi:conserved hypothetical protein [Burkholderia sp. H160]|nr:conserved hypothetical protein [Burkholderia sp. H160]
MNAKKPGCTRRVRAAPVVDAELEHLNWATQQPAQRLFDAAYWRRRVLAVKGRFELTERQLMQLEKILRRLAPTTE